MGNQTQENNKKKLTEDQLSWLTKILEKHMN